MTKNKKYYSQIFDYGIESGIIAQIGDKVFMLLVGLIPFTDEVGQCYPKEKTLARSIGMIGHILDQKRLGEGLYRHPTEDILYLE